MGSGFELNLGSRKTPRNLHLVEIARSFPSQASLFRVVVFYLAVCRRRELGHRDGPTKERERIQSWSWNCLTQTKLLALFMWLSRTFSFFWTACVFCLRETDDPSLYGQKLLYAEANAYVHYFCMVRTVLVNLPLYAHQHRQQFVTYLRVVCLFQLFASGLGQQGDLDEGIMGFLPTHLNKELKRGKRLVSEETLNRYIWILHVTEVKICAACLHFCRSAFSANEVVPVLDAATRDARTNGISLVDWKTAHWTNTSTILSQCSAITVLVLSNRFSPRVKEKLSVPTNSWLLRFWSDAPRVVLSFFLPVPIVKNIGHVKISICKENLTENAQYVIVKCTEKSTPMKFFGPHAVQKIRCFIGSVCR